MLEIRNYEKKDFENVRYVCLNSDGGNLEKELAEFVLCTFCDYYIENEPYNCFVLSDEGKAVGYVICAENFDNFKSVYDCKYKPKTSHMSEPLVIWSENAYDLQERFKEDYPAHLHIDLLPEYQRGGWGTKLINTLLERLKENKVKGVMLSAGTNNKIADSFYRKYGFEELAVCGTDIAFGLKLSE